MKTVLVEQLIEGMQPIPYQYFLFYKLLTQDVILNNVYKKTYFSWLLVTGRIS